MPAENNEKQPRGINSIEIGYRVLEAIQEGPESVALKTIAERAGLSASAAHNYLTSFVKTGMVRSDGRGLYALGPSLAAFGMTVMRQMDKYEVVQAEALRLREATGLGVAILIWTEAGTVIVFNKSGGQNWGAFDLRNGLVSTLWTGGGNVFVAYVERKHTLPVVQRELALPVPECNARMDAIAAEVQAHGYAIQDVKQLPGYRAASTPVWDANGDVIYALTLTAPQEQLDPRPEGPHLGALLKASCDLSRTFGAPPARLSAFTNG